MVGLGLVHSLYRAHRAVVPATAWHLVITVAAWLNKVFISICFCANL